MNMPKNKRNLGKSGSKNNSSNSSSSSLHKSKGNILVLCAHSDDQVLGVGGAMAKYAKEGYSVYTYIFSYGESSHPHMKLSYVAKTRVEESKAADEIIGGKGVSFLALKDTKIAKDFERKNMQAKLERIILDKKPKKIFTHSIDDALPDHRGVREVVLKTYDSLNKKNKFKAEVFTFDVWNVWNFKKRNVPALVVDITPVFNLKIKALHAFKSQINVFSYTYLVNVLYIGVYIRAFILGLKYGHRLAEVFYKER